MGRRAAGRDTPASPPSRQQMYCWASATQAAPGLPWEEGASDREEDGGQAHPPRGTHAADRTRPQSTATGEASVQDTRTLGRRGKQHPARSLLLTGTSLEEEVCDAKMLLLLSRFSRVRLCATPGMAAHQAPPSLRFSRQEHWSGLPFPSPMHESEK